MMRPRIYLIHPGQLGPGLRGIDRMLRVVAWGPFAFFMETRRPAIRAILREDLTWRTD